MNLYNMSADWYSNFERSGLQRSDLIKQEKEIEMTYEVEDYVFEDMKKEHLERFIRACILLLKFISQKESEIEDGGEVYNGISFRKDRGICNAVSHLVDALRESGSIGSFDVSSRLAYCFERWEHYSGYDQYPIPATGVDQEEMTAEDCYERCAHWTGEQLQLRRDLLEFIIVTAKSFLKAREAD